MRKILGSMLGVLFCYGMVAQAMSPDSSQSENDQSEMRFLLPGQVVIRARNMNKQEAVGDSLKSRFGRVDLTVIWNGETLDHQRTWAFYSIPNEATAVLLPMGADSPTKSRYLNLTRDGRYDDLNRHTGALFNENSRGECARLRDLALLRAEGGHRRRYRYPAPLNFKAAKPSQPTVIGPRLNTPNDGALPILWTPSPE